MALPDGQGSITFDGVARFANFQIAYDPGKEISLVAALLLLGGLTTSLVVRQRRVVVRVSQSPPLRPGDGRPSRTTVTVAALGLTRLGPPAGELDRLADALGRPPGSTTPATDAGAPPDHSTLQED